MTTLDDQWFTNDSESTPVRAFNANELVSCSACSRSNPPTRANCLYCGATLIAGAAAVTSDALSPAVESEAEDVFHVVAVTAGSNIREISSELARSLNLAPSELSSLLSGSVSPLYATTETNQAEEISEKLRSAGVEPLTLSDAQLNLATPPKPITALTLAGDGVTASVRRAAGRISVPWDDVTLIVPGRLYFTTTEVEQKRDKSKRVLDERQLTSDEAVLDTYSRADEIGWRIRAGSFDFSCLGAEKKPIAFENFRALVDLLRRNATHAVVDDRYVRIRGALNKVWPLEARAVGSERRRTLIREISATATTSDNELQFTRYSRLLRYLMPQA